MKSRTKSVTPNPESGDGTTRRGSALSSPNLNRVLDEIRAGARNALYGAGPEVSEELFAKHVASLIEGAGLPALQTMHYRWFLRELARLWRTRTGHDLAFHLELCIRKWDGLGLEMRTLQVLVCEAHQRLKGWHQTRTGSVASGSVPGPAETETTVRNATSARSISEGTPLPAQPEDEQEQV